MRKDKLVLKLILVILLILLIMYVIFNKYIIKNFVSKYFTSQSIYLDTLSNIDKNAIENLSAKTNLITNFDSESNNITTDSNNFDEGLKKTDQSIVQHQTNLMATPVLDKSSNTVYPLGNVYSKPMTKQEIRENLGRSTWTLLHTIAAVYPGIPESNHKLDVLKFIDLLSKLYPCGECAQHFQQLLSTFPPKVDNHDVFAGWLCDAHNIVNKRLKKDLFDCKEVDLRWECGCEVP